MTKPTALRCWLLALALMLAWPAWASRLALVIGNNAYQKVERLENARNDANLMATVLKKAGFDVTQASDLSHRALWDAIDTFKGRIQKGDEVVFYYAGHGVQINSNQLLLPVDIEAKNDAQVQRDGVALVDVQDALKDARFALLVIDACRDNPFPKVGTRAIGGGTRGLVAPDPGTGQIIMMSAGRNQKALDRVPGERQANGLFTWELVRVIQTPGVEIRNALEQVKTAVDAKARRAGHEQRPSLVNDLTGNFYFFGPTTVQVAPPAHVAPEMTANQREDAFWNDAKAAGNREAFEAYVDSYPKGRYASLARANVARLSAASVTPASPTANTVQPQPTATANRAPGKVFKDCPDCPEMVMVPAGSFEMGSNDGTNDETPVHRVSIGSFLLGRTEVTQGQWKAVMGSNPSDFNACGEDCPVERVSWNDAQSYAKKLSQQTGKNYRLPSEAEWEYAARAGSRGLWSFGDNESELGDHAWYPSNSGSTTHNVAQKRANAFGLYDMYGNVWELVEDVWHNNYNGAPSAGGPWTTGGIQAQRVRRGGSWNEIRGVVSSAYRDTNSPDGHISTTGFRIARTL